MTDLDQLRRLRHLIAAQTYEPDDLDRELQRLFDQYERRFGSDATAELIAEMEASWHPWKGGTHG